MPPLAFIASGGIAGIAFKIGGKDMLLTYKHDLIRTEYTRNHSI
jgi:hypothetical protein